MANSTGVPSRGVRILLEALVFLLAVGAALLSRWIWAQAGYGNLPVWVLVAIIIVAGHFARRFLRRRFLRKR